MSHWCRKIISFLEAEQNTFFKYLNCERFKDKFALIPLAIPVKPFEKPRRNDGRVKLLFVGTFHQSDMFLMKGGLEALECFRELGQIYPHLEFVIRSEVPASVRRKYEGLPGLRILDSPIPREALDAEFSSADIFLFPSLYSTPISSILEAMSYELPVVACNAFGTKELVRDGETGFLVPLPDRGEGGLHHDVLKGLVEKTSLLIEDASLRQRMGRAARSDVEEGTHSIGYRNKKLKEILDAATSDLVSS